MPRRRILNNDEAHGALERQVEHLVPNGFGNGIPARYCFMYTVRVGNGISMPLFFRVL
jgi:hypothetical protein